MGKMRLLTTKFMSYNISKAEKQSKKSIIDFLDIGNLSVEKIMQLISIGNNNCSEETAGQKLDNYLSDEQNSLIDAYLQLLTEIDMDLKILKKSGVSVDDIKEKFKENIEANASDEKMIHSEQVDQEKISTDGVAENTEKVRVDINGDVTST